MSAELQLRRIDLVESTLRNAVLTSFVPGLEITHLSKDVRYVSLDLLFVDQTCRVFIALQELVDFWLGEASVAAETIADDILDRFLHEELRTQGLPSFSDVMRWQAVTGFATDGDFVAPVALMSGGPIALYLSRLPDALRGSPPIAHDLPIDTRWRFGSKKIPAGSLTELAVGDVIPLPTIRGVVSMSDIARFSFYFHGDSLMLDSVHEEHPDEDDSPDGRAGEEHADETLEIEPTTSLALVDLPVTVSFLLSRRTMRAADVCAMQPGVTVPLDLLKPQIDVMAGGKLLARGELVRIGDGLGVEIMKAANGGTLATSDSTP